MPFYLSLQLGYNIFFDDKSDQVQHAATILWAIIRAAKDIPVTFRITLMLALFNEFINHFIPSYRYLCHTTLIRSVNNLPAEQYS